MQTKSEHKQKKGAQIHGKEILFTVLFAVVMDTFFALLAHFAIGGAAGALYLQMVLLTLSAFITAFFSLLFCRSTLVGMVCPNVIHFFVYGIAIGFTGTMLLWMLLYILSGFVGLAIAYIAITHKNKSY